MLKDKRRHPRKRVDLDLEFVLEGEDARVLARGRDMSLGGMYFIVDPAPEYGARVRLYVDLPGVAEAIEIPATVQWLGRDGVGVQFGALGVRQTYEITEFLVDLEEIPDSRRLTGLP
jgi:type IV pilus assembly protein PilZ